MNPGVSNLAARQTQAAIGISAVLGRQPVALCYSYEHSNSRLSRQCGSRSDYEIVDLCQRLLVALVQVPWPYVIGLARNVGSHLAAICSLEDSQGDSAAVLAADLQDPRRSSTFRGPMEQLMGTADPRPVRNFSYRPLGAFRLFLGGGKTK
jgi:hypothetical protein